MFFRSFLPKILILPPVLLFAGVGCRPPQGTFEIEKVTLNYWQVWQDSKDLEPLIKKYQQLYPQVTIHFRNLRFEEYEEEILKALAEDRGPDIFSIPHDWIGLYRPIIEPMPKEAAMTRVQLRAPGPGEVEPTVEKVYQEKTNLLTPRDIKQFYYPFIREDILEKGSTSADESTGVQKEEERIVALPLYIDALAMYYNKEMLEKYDMYDPPETWEKFQQDVILMAQVDAQNNIIQAGTALGTAYNLIRPTDIVSALMLQTGVQMIDEDNAYATFHQSVRESDNYNAGLEALRFYTDFSDPSKKVYTWNEQEGHALQLFKQGKIAYLFGYSYNLDDIRSSRVSIGVSPLPSPKDAVSHITLANYWVETVSKKSAHADVAWHFLNFISQPKNLAELQSSASVISPRKEHAGEIADEDVGVFARAAQEAQVWYHGKDAPAAEEALLDMITSVVLGKQSMEEAISFGAQRVTQTLK